MSLKPIKARARPSRSAIEKATTGGATVVLPSTEERRAAAERLRAMVERAREGGAKIDPDAVRREVAILRAGVAVTPARRPEELEPGWAERLADLIDQVRAGVPEEWTEEELQERIAEAIAEVRAARASHR